jgi:putative oxidoreductase
MTALIRLHDAVFSRLQRALEGWALGLLARLVFAGTLLVYYWHSATTKVGEGVTGFFRIQDGAYWQMLGEPLVAEYNYDAGALPFFPYDLIVGFGTYAEFLLPLLIVLGLATRLASLGMIGFILVQSYVDITVHAADATTIGAWFDRFPDAAILDQRAFWIFGLTYLAVRGAGAVSLESLLAPRQPAPAAEEPGLA